MKKSSWIFFFFFLSLVCVQPVIIASETPPQAPTKGMVTMVDIGAKKCIPCKMMAPIMEELEKEYKGKASILFIDVWEYPNEAPKYGIRTIPTQIFYDKDGKEVFRHVGFMDKKSIVTMLEKLGVAKEEIVR